MPDETSAGSTLRLEPDLEGTTPVLTSVTRGWTTDARTTPGSASSSPGTSGAPTTSLRDRAGARAMGGTGPVRAPPRRQHRQSGGPHLQCLRRRPEVRSELALDRRTAAALKAGGFSVVSLANNHLRDAGDRGVLDTLAACDDAGLHRVGGGKDAREALEPSVLEIEGFTLGIIAVAEREFSIAGPRRPGAAPLEPYATPERVRSLGPDRRRHRRASRRQRVLPAPEPAAQDRPHALPPAARAPSSVTISTCTAVSKWPAGPRSLTAQATSTSRHGSHVTPGGRPRGYAVSLTVGEGGVAASGSCPSGSRSLPRGAPRRSPRRGTCARTCCLSRGRSPPTDCCGARGRASAPGPAPGT